MILAGDVGGTNSRLALCEIAGGRIELRHVQVYDSRSEESLLSIVASFLREHPLPIDRAAFGVAGPVRDGRSRISNLDWVVDARRLAEVLGLASVVLVNDLEAKAWGIGCLEPRDFAVLNAGEPNPRGNQALIAAGTGLGEAGLQFQEEGYCPFASEGGHADFAARNDREAALMLRLREEYSHVSFERVLSGPGLYNLYRFLRDSGRGEEPSWLAEEMRAGDPPRVITRRALAGAPPICVDALDLFVSIYGAEAGNLALKLLATGGVFVGGGIAPRILPRLAEGPFMAAFAAKGRMSWLVEKIPVKVILNDSCALYGAARLANR